MFLIFVWNGHPLKCSVIKDNYIYTFATGPSNYYGPLFSVLEVYRDFLGELLLSVWNSDYENCSIVHDHFAQK